MSNVSQVKRKPVRITLSDGHERELKITLNAMAELEEEYGSVEEAFKKLETGSIKAIRKILWAALLHDDEHPLTEQQLGNMIDTNNLDTLMSKLTEVVTEDMPNEQTDVVDVDSKVTDAASPN